MPPLRRRRWVAGVCSVWLCVSGLLSSPARTSAEGQSPTEESPAVEDARPDEAAPNYGAVATATRLPRPRKQVAATVSVLDREEIDQSPALTTDVLVRSLPSVATFRQSTSLTADPTSQGLNLRGVGPSGVSRTLVLVDGIPANDPFGGWLYWRALPMLGLERVEALHGGASALYGSAALAGVVQLVSRSPWDEGFDLDMAYGSLQTLLARGRAARAFGDTAVSVEGSFLDTDGYVLVPAAQRGAVDRSASSLHGNLRATVAVRPTPRLRLTTTLDGFVQRLHRGTRLTTADVESGLASFGARLRLPNNQRLETTLYARALHFEQTRPHIDAARATESLARSQDVPAGDGGASLVFIAPSRLMKNSARARQAANRRLPPSSAAAKMLGISSVVGRRIRQLDARTAAHGGFHQPASLQRGGEHTVSAGLDVRHLRGEARERSYRPDASEAVEPTRRVAGGRQLFVGAFVQELYAPVQTLELEGALRADVIRTSAGHVQVTPPGGETRRSTYSDNVAFELSPRGAVRWDVRRWLTLRSSVYRSFRAPTLNESFRPFQVGGVTTAANAALRPEHLTGVEAGAVFAPMSALHLSATGYWNRLEDPIVNVTLEAPLPDGATRQRQNLGKARATGLELGLDTGAFRHLTGSVRYTLAATEVSAAPGRPEVVGKRLPHAPVHRALARLSFDDPRLFTLALSWRYVGSRFEDDLNSVRLDDFHVVDVLLRRQLVWHLWAFAAVENLLNARYLVAKSAVDELGPPFMARLGLSIRQGREQ